MNSSKYLKIASLVSALLTVVLYCVFSFQASMTILEFKTALFPLYFAEAFLVLTVAFLVCLIICKKTSIDFNRVKKGLIAFIIIAIVCCTAFCCYAYVDCYKAYMSGEKINNDIAYMKKFYPYKNLDDYSTEQLFRDFEISHIPGTDFIQLNYGNIDPYVDVEKSNSGYRMEYIKSSSPLMNFKFFNENIWPSAINEIDESQLPEVRIMEVDGVIFVAYINRNNYGVFVSSLGESAYAILTDASDDVTVENFAREVFKQMDLLSEAVIDRYFLDASVS